MNEAEEVTVEASDPTMIPYVGALTAVKNSNVPMTVSKLIDNDFDPMQIECMYFVGSTLKTMYADPDAFIGFGENLVFSSGAFQYAFTPDEDGTDGA